MIFITSESYLSQKPVNIQVEREEKNIDNRLFEFPSSQISKTSHIPLFSA